MSEPAPRSRLAAALLSLVAPGLGQIYLGRTGRGLAWMGGALVLPFVPAVVASELGKGAFVALTIAGLALVIGGAVDAVRFCTPVGAVPTARVATIGVVFYFVGPILIALFLRAFVVEAFKIPSGSMIPTLVVGDHVFADKIVFRKREPRRGDVMIFAYPEHPEQDFVKRVVAVGGDRIEVRGGHPILNGWEVPSCAAGHWGYTDTFDAFESSKRDGDLYVEFLDGVAYLTFYDKNGFGAEYQGPWTVEAGHYFVMGDNRNNAHDSRMWFGGAGGTVPRANVRGRPRFVWLSVATDGSSSGRFGLDLGDPDPALPRDVDRAAVDACLRARPPRDKTVPPGR